MWYYYTYPKKELSMYSPDHADTDPRNPANQSERTYKVCDYSAINGVSTIIDVLDETFTTEAEATNRLLSLTEYNGEELTVCEFKEDGDEMCVYSAIWDEDQKRYVEA